MRVAGVDLADAHVVGGGNICRAWRTTTADGRAVFVKTLTAAPPGFFAAEADGLRWLTAPSGPPVPDVVAVGEDGLVLEWVDPGRPSSQGAEAFGRALAAMHRCSPDGFGRRGIGFIGSLSLPNEARGDWPTFYVEQRIAPYLPSLSADQRHVVEQVCARIHDVAGPAEPAARLHGDLWSGNLLWGGDGQVWLIDAGAAHGGHRETDLAMLALFGAAHLDVVIAAYDEVAPLADGWRGRIPLHQLHPLLVHATLFGGGYGARAASAARAALAA